MDMLTLPPNVNFVDEFTRHDHCETCGADLGVNGYHDEDSMEEPVYCSEKCAQEDSG